MKTIWDELSPDFEVYDEDTLPGRYRAQVAIRRQPFFGDVSFKTKRAFWIGSHRLWVVGDARGILEAKAEFNRQYLDVMKPIFEGREHGHV